MALIDNIERAYSMNDNAATTVVVDASGTLDGTASFNTDTKDVAGHLGGALTFDGTNDRVDIGTPSVGGSSQFTFSAWVKIDTDGDTGVIIGYRNDGTLVWKFLHVNGTGVISGNLRTGGGVKAVTMTSTINDNLYHLVVWSYDGTNSKIYLDNVLEVSTAFVAPGALPLQLGENEFSGGNDLTGNLDDVNIWSSALTDGGISVSQSATGEIGDLWNGGTGITYPFSAVTATTRKIKISGTFQDKPIKTKVAGTFEDKPIKIKVGGTFQDA